MAGIATRHEVAQVASEKALLKRASTLRPSLNDPTPGEVGYRLGTSKGQGVWASVEDSILLIGPPRSGKGLHIVIPAILDAPGPVVTTSTRPDNLTATLRARQRRGPVAVFDPQHLAEGLPAGMRWSPVRGCEDPLTAMIRATGLASATGLSAGGVESGGFWEGKTRTALQSLLHAAALDSRKPADLFRWTLDPAAAAEAVAILTNHPQAAAGWADSLGAMIDADPKTRDSIWQGVALALGALADPRVLDAVTPREGETPFDPETFLRESGTLYLLATGAGAGASAALVAGPGSPRCPSSNRSPRHATSGPTTKPERSGTQPSSNSSSVAPPTVATSKTSPPSSANATNTPTPSPSVTTEPGLISAPCGGCRSCHPIASAPSPSAPASPCCAPRRRSSPT